MLNLIAGILCLSEPSIFALVHKPLPVWAVIALLIVGAFNIIIWERSR